MSTDPKIRHRRNLLLTAALLFGPALLYSLYLLYDELRPIDAWPVERLPTVSADWQEPESPAGSFAHWRLDGAGALLGATEHRRHLHSACNAWLVSTKKYAAPTTVSTTGRFLVGRYLGCYLCFDPDTKTGYWMGTGHHRGEDPFYAYIKVVRRGEWTELAHAPLPLA
ncbi:MAG: hypothetical protein ACRDD1_20955, partial [Planctomycetia bacterium]